MSHKIRDAERRRIRDSLEAVNCGDWLKIASEIDYSRNQIYFWLLIRNSSTVLNAVKKAIQVLQPFALKHPSVDFNASFTELTETQEIDWETLDDEDIRHGKTDHPAGSSPWKRARPDTTVFDRPEYSIPPSEEPI